MRLADLQNDHASFVERSRDRERQKRILKELFQTGEMKVAMFRHLNRILDAAQRADERRTGQKFTTIYDGATKVSRRPGRATDAPQVQQNSVANF
jgi:hypothetical protein